MVSRIRSHSSRAESAATRSDKHSRALTELVLDIVSQSPGSVRERKQNRIIIKIAMAMTAMLSCAGRKKSAIHLTDLSQLDDPQFDRIIEALRDARSTARQLTGRHGCDFTH
jgi:hypothetical protein